MKKFLTFLTVGLVLLAFGNLQAADNYYTGTVTVVDDGFYKLVYKYVTPLMADSTGSYHSPPIYIGGANVSDGWIEAVTANVTGTEDVNVLLKVSANKVGWTSITVAGLDQLTGATAKMDTVGITTGTDDLAFHTARWLVIECDGQTSNPAATYVTVYLTLRKEAALIFNNSPIKVNGIQRTPQTGDTNP